MTAARDGISIAAGLSTIPAAPEAALQAAREAKASIDGAVDLSCLFLSPAHLAQAEAAAAAIREELRPRHLIGCVAQGVLGRAREVEQGPAVAVWAASLPGARLEPFHATTLDMEDGVAVAGFPEQLDPAVVVMLVDPYSFPAGPFLAKLNEERPELPLVGGIAAGGDGPGEQALIVDDEIHGEGAVGVAVSDVHVLTIVSQGCAPVGRDAVVTRAEGNIVYELAGQPALERLRAEIAALEPEQQRLAAQGILAGIVIDENRSDYGRGDYLMRGVLGADESTGAIAVGERVRVGQTLRFHVRDARSADEDLRGAVAQAVQPGEAAGALVFTCNGRGTNMFPTPDHDARTVSDALGSDRLAGFFCGGEIGPVGGQAFLHGFTATLAVFLQA
jgi:small ligand-binding sensory domain FIST